MSRDRYIMIRPHMRNLPKVKLPSGFSFKNMQTSDLGTWIEIIRRAESNFNIPCDLFHQEFGNDLASVPERCFFVLNPLGFPVGTISAWYSRVEEFRGWGTPDWMGVIPEYQKMGLGRALFGHSIRVLSKYHDKSCLFTHTHRKFQIEMYRSFGFRKI